MADNLNKKYDTLKKILKDIGKVVVAYSGGVDSTFLLKVAVDTLAAENVLACIAVSPSLPKHQFSKAIDYAEDIGAVVRILPLEELSDPNYSANKADRCFHCKSHLFKVLNELAENENYDHVICGSNFDDKDDYRPGNRAAQVFEVRAPLMEAELTKKDIRNLSRDLMLPTADVPASPCLASRLIYGLEVTEERLNQVEQAEDFLRSLGFIEFRVRHHDTVARIEINPVDFPKLTSDELREQILEKIKSLGFQYVTLDLQGFRSGSLNESLSESEKQKNL
ncbi:MAG: ATP-dependent sacrificial sulfur transferase LarE [Planctomycetota bacterium]|jgi:uncharacterized protein